MRQSRMRILSHVMLTVSFFMSVVLTIDGRAVRKHLARITKQYPLIFKRREDNHED
jgi:hypothetical protein